MTTLQRKTHPRTLSRFATALVIAVLSLGLPLLKKRRSKAAAAAK